MSKLIDVLSDAGLRTGEILSRPAIHRLGKPHRVVHLYLFNSKNELLLQKRAPTVDLYPGYFSISVLGHINAGEFSSDTVIREMVLDPASNLAPVYANECRDLVYFLGVRWPKKFAV